MIRRIKPVPRIIKISTEIRRIKREPVVHRQKFLEWDETWIPRVDIYEKPKEIVVEAEIPGVAQSDITITVQSNRMEIRGMKKESLSSEKIKYLRLEREFGSFRRLVALPGTVVPDKAKAFLENGVLMLRLRKYCPKEDKDTLIEIKKNEG
jgi:HSP20 family molecular chaperone IbpA